MGLLQEQKYQEALQGLFDAYSANFEDEFCEAIAKNGDKIPSNLASDIFQLLNSISRSLHESGNLPRAVRILEDGQNIHLQKAIIEIYKIKINQVLNNITPAIKNFRALTLYSEFHTVAENVPEKLRKIKELKGRVTDLYLSAKKDEVRGNYLSAIGIYKSVLTATDEIKPILSEVNRDPAYAIVYDRMKEREKAEKKQRRFTVLTVVISCLLTAALTLIVEVIIKTCFV